MASLACVGLEPSLNHQMYSSIPGTAHCHFEEKYRSSRQSSQRSDECSEKESDQNFASPDKFLSSGLSSDDMAYLLMIWIILLSCLETKMILFCVGLTFIYSEKYLLLQIRNLLSTAFVFIFL